ncbi:MAG: class I SAM-dependent methyltransferase [Opitutus sp.]
MWFYRALHAHLEGELATGLTDGRGVPGSHLADSEADGRIRILDAGCGTGGLIRRTEARHADWTWTGVDVEPIAVELARSRCKAEIVQASLLELPFEDARFDAVVCSDVLYHLDDDAGAVTELGRVLRPDGLLVINVPAHRWLWSYHDVTVHGRRRYVRDDVRELLQTAGFRTERITHWNALPLPLVVARRKLLPPPRSGSDVCLYPAPIEAAFRTGAALERWWLRTIGTLPFGSSILARARKPASLP